MGSVKATLPIGSSEVLNHWQRVRTLSKRRWKHEENRKIKSPEILHSNRNEETCPENAPKWARGRTLVGVWRSVCRCSSQISTEQRGKGTQKGWQRSLAGTALFAPRPASIVFQIRTENGSSTPLGPFLFMMLLISFPILGISRLYKRQISPNHP